MVKPASKATPPWQLIALQAFNALKEILSGYGGCSVYKFGP